MKPILAVVAMASVTALLSGCGPTRSGKASIAEDAQTQMVGLTKREVLECAGIPRRTMQSDGVEYLRYSYRWQGGNDGDIQTRNCDVTTTLSDGRVSKVDYRGRTGGLLAKRWTCYYVIENCVQ